MLTIFAKKLHFKSLTGFLNKPLLRKFPRKPQRQTPVLVRLQVEGQDSTIGASLGIVESFSKELSLSTTVSGSFWYNVNKEKDTSTKVWNTFNVNHKFINLALNMLSFTEWFYLAINNKKKEIRLINHTLPWSNKNCRLECKFLIYSIQNFSLIS